MYCPLPVVWSFPLPTACQQTWDSCHLPFPLHDCSFGTFRFKVVWLKTQLVFVSKHWSEGSSAGGLQMCNRDSDRSDGEREFSTCPCFFFPSLTSAQLEIPGSDGWGWEDSGNCNMIWAPGTAAARHKDKCGPGMHEARRHTEGLCCCCAQLCSACRGPGRKEGGCCCTCWEVRGAAEAEGQMRCRKNLPCRNGG